VEGISDIRIVGLDEKRPPRIRPEPYIDVVFKLSHQAPTDWCRDFNNLLSKYPASPKIKDSEGLYIEAWVRKPDEIVTLLDTLKAKIKQCSDDYIERIEALARDKNSSNQAHLEESGEQGRLNRILAELDYDS
jgi:hypothetical protein